MADCIRSCRASCRSQFKLSQCGKFRTTRAQGWPAGVNSGSSESCTCGGVTRPVGVCPAMPMNSPKRLIPEIIPRQMLPRASVVQRPRSRASDLSSGPCDPQGIALLSRRSRAPLLSGPRSRASSQPLSPAPPERSSLGERSEGCRACWSSVARVTLCAKAERTRRPGSLDEFRACELRSGSARPVS